MKRGFVIIFCLIFVMLLISPVSAGWFTDFWAKITGQAAGGDPVPDPIPSTDPVTAPDFAKIEYIQVDRCWIEDFGDHGQTLMIDCKEGVLSTGTYSNEYKLEFRSGDMDGKQFFISSVSETAFYEVFLASPPPGEPEMMGEVWVYHLEIVSLPDLIPYKIVESDSRVMFYIKNIGEGTIYAPEGNLQEGVRFSLVNLDGGPNTGGWLEEDQYPIKPGKVVEEVGSSLEDYGWEKGDRIAFGVDGWSWYPALQGNEGYWFQLEESKISELSEENNYGFLEIETELSKECIEHEDCPAGYECKKNTCVKKTLAGCENICYDTKECSEGECISGCNSCQTQGGTWNVEACECVSSEIPCTSNNDCSRTEFCEKSSCDERQGICELKPEYCTDIAKRVCGCDGKTYGNDCYRKQAGVVKAYEGECQVPNDKNEKDPVKFSEKETFLISDKNWKDVLPLVPLTTWTSQEDVDESWCQKGYGTPEDVCVYPTLIWHEEEGGNSQISLSDFVVPSDIIINGMEYSEWKDVIDYIYFGYFDDDNNYIDDVSLIPLGQKFYVRIHIHSKINPAYPLDTIKIKSWRYPSSVEIVSGNSLIEVNQNLEHGYLYIDSSFSAPLFIFKNPVSSGFDIDSSVYFMQQYSPSKLKIIGETPQEMDNLFILEPEMGAGLALDQIGRINLEEKYLSYWESYADIVYVEDNYELALLASTYASLINAPLVIEGTALDKNEAFAGRNVICVGNTGIICNDQYNLEQLQQEYVDKTGTDKIILVNPNDLSIKINEAFWPEKSANLINEIYGKASLAAPILASAKQEIILSTNEIDYEKVDRFIEERVEGLYASKNDVRYLTILASPDAIRNYKENLVITPGSSAQYADSEVEWIYYSDIDEDKFPDLAVGRIYGITISDNAAYVSRSVFLHEILSQNKYIVLSEPTGLIMNVPAIALSKHLSNSLEGTSYFLTQVGGDEITKEYIEQNVLDKSLVSTFSHGYTQGGLIYTNDLDGLYFSPSIYLSYACSTCSYQNSDPKQYLFCTNLLRKGSMGVVGAVDVASSMTSKFMHYVSKNQDIGTAMKSFKTDLYKRIESLDKYESDQEEYDAGLHEFLKGNFVLLGDPTINFNVNVLSTDPLVGFEIIDVSDQETKVRINVPEPTEETEEIWFSEKITSWVIPSYENVLIPFGVNGRYLEDLLYLQSTVGNIQIQSPEIASFSEPLGVTYINGGGERIIFQPIDPITWENPEDPEREHLMKIGILDDRLSIKLFDYIYLDGTPKLEDSSYEIIFRSGGLLR